MVTDFEFDGIDLSALGYAIVSFDGTRSGEVETDSQLSFNHTSSLNGKRQRFTKSIYDDPLQMEFYIAKNMCLFNNSMTEEDYVISLSEMAFLKRWLNSPTPKKLKVNDEEYNGVYWQGSFNVEEYIVGGKRVGAKLKFECDAPFGYMESTLHNDSLTANGSYSYNCTSDEVGWIYPTLTIIVRQAGNLEIRNASDNRVTRVNNCAVSEMITFDENLQITTNMPEHNVADDFNYVFYRVNNSFKSVENTIQSNLPIEFAISYTPYAKVVAI